MEEENSRNLEVLENKSEKGKGKRFKDKESKGNNKKEKNKKESNHRIKKEDKKNKKEKKKLSKKTKIIIITIILVILLCAISVSLFLIFRPKFKEATIELGTTQISVDNFLVSNMYKENAKLITPLDQIDFSKVSDIDIQLSYRDKEETVKLSKQ